MDEEYELTGEQALMVLDHYILELSTAAGLRKREDVYETTLGELLETLVEKLERNEARNAIIEMLG